MEGSRGQVDTLHVSEVSSVPECSLEKPWNERPEAAKKYENAQPSGPSLPSALLDLVANSPPQNGLTNYDEVHTWWWVAYEAMLADLKMQKDSGWEEIEASVKR